ncbi:hypothetical protein TD95_000938 [Thielaviopsis punctulata]|uniref:Uncharacterized protein n=1 Tax=Thielaviopsis punctulata TaxID=72032 RepID=A0A0F4ZGI1_9PEZI|nr:hypothetical protein TD95_000938 [Thielaviopsis punctulata]
MQGFNMGRYYPPSIDSPPNPSSKPRTAGPPVIRFEMPFSVWCTTCTPPTLIGQGTRFNAEKHRVGAYLSTPIWAFRMRHAACRGAIEVRTDPQHTAYVVAAGARRQDKGADAATHPLAHWRADDGAPAHADAGPRVDADARQSAFRRLEKTIVDRAVDAAATARVDALHATTHRAWADPYSRNQALRAAFRTRRRADEAQEAADEAVRARLGLGDAVRLVPGTREDAVRAGMVEFAGEEGQGRMLGRGIFERGKKEKGKSKEEKKKTAFVAQVVGNTRLASDPFLVEKSDKGKPGLIAGIKRKRIKVEEEEEKEGKPLAVQQETAVAIKQEGDEEPVMVFKQEEDEEEQVAVKQEPSPGNDCRPNPTNLESKKAKTSLVAYDSDSDAEST